MRLSHVISLPQIGRIASGLCYVHVHTCRKRETERALVFHTQSEEEDYKLWPATKSDIVAEPQRPCLASFICVNLNVSDPRTNMIRWRHKRRQWLEQMQRV